MADIQAELCLGDADEVDAMLYKMAQDLMAKGIKTSIHKVEYDQEDLHQN